MVLEKDSSVLGYPGEISKPLDADHHGVCKFDGLEDPKYITVRNILVSLVRNAQSEVTRGTKYDLTEHLAISESESPETDYNFFHDRWVPGTCHWILQDPAFRGWLEDSFCKPRVLWIHGNAASGKSILSSFIINHLVHQGLPCHYFFIRFTHLKKRALNIVLRSLAYQLATSTPAYADSLRQLESAFTDLKSADYRTVWQWLFKQSLFHLGIGSRIYLVIDGVDEADNPAALIRLLSEVHLTTVPLRILVVSQKTHEISSNFQKLSRQVHMETIRTEGQPQDFKSYIDQEMDLAGDDSYRDEVTAKLLDRARGNFLWVHLAVQKINSCYTRTDVEKALRDLPPGMEACYHRMASTVLSGARANNQNIGQTILGWVACAHRILAVEELCDALDNDGVLEIQRTIGDLCGGFVVLDNDGRCVMIHETAREYLLQTPKEDRPMLVNPRTTNDVLLKKCLERLTSPSLRSQLNRNQLPPLLEYATTAWFVHFSCGTIVSLDVLDAVTKFLQGPHVLTWIYIAARRAELKTLFVASRYLTDVVATLRIANGPETTLRHHQAVSVLEGWASDLIKIVGKFGGNLRQHPDSIYKLIPPFCPSGSVIYQQFGHKESRSLQVSATSGSSNWDDCLARFSFSSGIVASAVVATGSRIAVLTNVRKTSHIILYNASTLEEQRRLSHPERVFSVQVSRLGELLVSYGYLTTRLWDMATGECLRVVKNPAKRPRPHTLYLDEKMVLVGSEDRCIRMFLLDDDSTEWQTLSHIDEQSLEFTTVNFPMCSALSPDGNVIAFGYRGHPATAWELNNPPVLLGQCRIMLDATDMTGQDITWGEVFRLVWHPFSGEVLGLTQVGLLFKWDPYEEHSSSKIETGADIMTVSRDGSLIATGDGVGTIKILAYADFSLLYSLSSQDPVIYLSFSTDSRRLYDIRGTYGNVWEPNTLLRIADSAEYAEHNSDAGSESRSLAKTSLQTEHHFARVDNVITLAGQPTGPLYCYGTEEGVAVLCEVGRGKVCDLERLSSYMSIEQMAWSEDGRLLAIMDLSRRLSIRTVIRAGESRDTWQVHHEFDVVIDPDKGYVTQLIFHPTGHGLFAATSTTIFSIDLDSRAVTESNLPAAMSKVKWAFHPTLADYLLAFGNTAVRIFNWTSLHEIEVHPYFPPRLPRSVTVSRDGRTGSFQGKDSEVLGRLICDADSAHVLLEISQPAISGQVESQYLLFDIGDIDPDTEDKECGKTDLPYTLLPREIASRIREPLAFLSRRRLVFLDIERWVCTWRLPTSSAAAPRSQSAWVSGRAGTPGIEQYYFLPGDWVAANEAHLCAVMPDGTLLCPRNGDVVTVQCARLRK